MGIRQALERGSHGDYVVINTDTGEYVAGKEREFLSRHAMEQWPFAGRFRERAGYRAVARSGFCWEEVPRMTATVTEPDVLQEDNVPAVNPADPNTIGRLGRMHYEAGIRQRLEPEFYGKYVAINVQTGQYQVAETLDEAFERGVELWPNGSRYVHRIGYRGVARIGNVASKP
jgi:hypothetical protein